MLWFLRTVRIVAYQALSFGDRVVQYGSGGIYALVACQTQLFFGFHKLEFVITAWQRRVAHRTLPYLNLKGAVQIFVLHDSGVALA
jgi:hypothetical protein